MASGQPYSNGAHAQNGALHLFPTGAHPDDDENDELYDDGSDMAPNSDHESGDSSIGNAALNVQPALPTRRGTSTAPVFNAKRHMTCGNPSPDIEHKEPHWRLNPQHRLKTMQAALILCLNIGCDPPDVVKTNPCAVLECWVDPYSMPPSKALETIGRNLQRQFEILNAKGKYKSYLDPSVDDFKNYMITLRARTKEERALVYYNGHGVPKPTANGEFWVFNRNYTQYIPVSINDFQDWIASPSIFIWDCSAAGNILSNYKRFAEPKDEQMRKLYPDGKYPPDYTPFMDCLQLLACGPNETLPMSPDLPADVFTACLTSPIEMALRFFVLQNKRYTSQLTSSLSLEQLTKIPGSLKDRRSPLGELYWIFTAVTDTIAWSTFSTDIFRRLFRQDLVTASLFRHFLLAERVMRAYDCTPMSHPPLAPTHTHKMWAAWDHAVDICLSRLPAYIQLLPPPAEPPAAPAAEGAPPPPPPEEEPPLPDWPANPFFAEHLTAFQVWLNRGSSPVEDAAMRYQPTATRSGSGEGAVGGSTGGGSRGFMYHPTEEEQNNPRRPPYQLPVLLQVLLSQSHRLRALILLAQFVDLGPWAVHLSLEIGIFPYIQRLLQSPAPDVRPLLIFIWARIFAIDPSCQVDLMTPVGYKYFAAVLAPIPTIPPGGVGAGAGGAAASAQMMAMQMQVQITNASEHRAMCAFILGMIARDHPAGANACFSDGVVDSALARLGDEDWFLRQWSALSLGVIWDAKDDIKSYALAERSAHERLMEMVGDDVPDVRAAALFALGTFLGASASRTDERKGGGGTGGLLPYGLRDQFRIEVAVGTRVMLAGREDASPLVRKELVVLLSALVVEWRGWFVVAAWCYWEWDRLNREALARAAGNRSSVLEEDEDDADAKSYTDRSSRAHAQAEEDFQTIIAQWIVSASASDPRLAPPPSYPSHSQPTFHSPSPPSSPSHYSQHGHPHSHLYSPDPELIAQIQEENRVLLSSFFTILAALFDLSVDPYPEVATMSQMVVDFIFAHLVESKFAELEGSTLHEFPRRGAAFGGFELGDEGIPFPGSPAVSVSSAGGIPGASGPVPSSRSAFTRSPTPSHGSTTPRPRIPSLQMTPSIAAELQNAMPYRRGSLQRTESLTTSLPKASNATPTSPAPLSASQSTLKRTASLAASLKSLATGLPVATESTPSSPVTTIGPGSGLGHILDRMGLVVPEPHVMAICYAGPWSAKAASTPLPGPPQRLGPSMSSASAMVRKEYERNLQERQQQSHQRQNSTKVVTQGASGSSNGIKLSPSWTSLSSPRSSHPQSSFTFPSKQSSNGFSSNSHSQQQHPQIPTFTPLDVIHALIDEDLNRQKARQAQYGEREYLASLGPPNPLALGKVETIASGEFLPIRSTLWDSCAEYYREPQMKRPDVDEPGSIAYSVQMWKRLQMDERASEATRASRVADFCPWDKSVSTFNAEMPVSKISMHSSLDLLAAADDTNVVSVWDWSKKKRSSIFSNANPVGSVITHLDFINQEEDCGMLLVGSSDAVVRIYRNYASLAPTTTYTNNITPAPAPPPPSYSSYSISIPNPSALSFSSLTSSRTASVLSTATSTTVRSRSSTSSSSGVAPVENPVELVTAWRVMNDRIKVKRGSGLVLDWQQDTGLLLAGGDTRAVRIWDVQRELCAQEFPTHAAASVTSLAWDPKTPSTLFATGHADGTLHIFDRRLRPGAVFRTSEGHQSWIRKVHWQARGRGELVTGSADGSVIVWDIRKAVPSVITAPQGAAGMSGMAVHDEANVIVSTSQLTSSTFRQQTLSVDAIPLYNKHHATSTMLTRLNFPTGLAHAPASPIDIASNTGLAFHPYRMIHASGGADGVLRLYGAKTEGVRPRKIVTKDITNGHGPLSSRMGAGSPSL